MIRKVYTITIPKLENGLPDFHRIAQDCLSAGMLMSPFMALMEGVSQLVAIGELNPAEAPAGLLVGLALKGVSTDIMGNAEACGRECDQFITDNWNSFSKHATTPGYLVPGTDQETTDAHMAAMLPVLDKLADVWGANVETVAVGVQGDTVH